MLKTYSDLSDKPYFSRELFDRVEKALVDEGADPHFIQYQFFARADLDGIPHVLHATVETKDQTNG